MILPGYQTSDSASSSKFHRLALLLALVLHQGDLTDFNFAILYIVRSLGGGIQCKCQDQGDPRL